MFDIGWQELFVIGAVTLVVVGPKDLPRVLKQVSLYVRKARSIAREFQSGIDEVMREAELDDIRKQIEGGGLDDIGGEIKKSLEIDDDFGDQFREVKAEVEDATKAIEAPAIEAPAVETTPEPAAEPATEPQPEPESAPAAEPQPEPAASEPEPEAGATEPQPEPAAKAAKSSDSASG